MVALSQDGILAAVFWVVGVLCWVLLAYGWRINSKSALYSVLPSALFATVIAIFLTVRAALA